MELFISDALAQSGESGGGFISLIPLILIFVLFYFLLIRPQQKKTKKHKQMVEAIQVGDEIITNGGTLGKIKAVDVNFVGLEVAPGVTIQVQRMAIAQLVPRDTMKTDEDESKSKKSSRRKKKSRHLDSDSESSAE